MSNQAKSYLPDGWRWVRLSDVCNRISNGSSAFQNIEHEGLPVTRIETISSGEIRSDKVGWIDLPQAQLQRHIMRLGDILLSHINSFERLGNCAIYAGNPPILVHGMNLLRLEVKTNIADPYYVLRYLKSDGARNFYNEKAQRAIGQASINIRDLNELTIPLPPLPEQQRDLSPV